MIKQNNIVHNRLAVKFGAWVECHVFSSNKVIITTNRMGMTFLCVFFISFPRRLS